MSSNNVLADKDINAAVDIKEKGDVKSMEYHRQVLQSKIEESQGNQTYVSPSDTIMSPCTQKLSALRGKHAGKAKPRSLFAKTSAKNLSSGNMFGAQIPKNSEDMNMKGQ